MKILIVAGGTSSERMNSKFIPPNDPILTKVAKEIPDQQISSKETRDIIQKMLLIAFGEQKDESKPIMVGLAAPQIGILKRIILVDVKADGKGPLRPRLSSTQARSEARKVGDLRVYVNPEITWKSREKGEWYEGCYSTGKVCGIVSRPVSIKIRYVQVAPQPRTHLNMREEKYTGYAARIFQHEIDHLNGKRFPDLIKDPNKLHWVLKKEFPLYRNKQAWRNWPKKCSFKKWQTIKNPLLKTA